MNENRLRDTLKQFLKKDIWDLDPLEGGDEAIVLRADSADGPLVVHISPSWRTRAELTWAHSVARYAKKSIPQVVAPLERNRTTLFEFDGRLAAVFPYVCGQMLNREDSLLREKAAKLLAAIHCALQTWDGGSRPGPGPGKPALFSDPDGLDDPTLDRWWVRAKKHGFKPGPTHGDYYRRNLLCIGQQILGVIDWHDASVRPLVVELAGATFEFCRNDDHVLDFKRADAFVAAYRNSGGPVPDSELTLLLPLIRLWIRNDARNSLAYDQGSGANEYAEKQISAFQALSACSWQPKIK